MEASESKWVNPVLNIIGVNSLRLGGIQLISKSFINFISQAKVEAEECEVCERRTTCKFCLESLGCGWCYNKFNPTVGLCTSGDFTSPHRGMNMSLYFLINMFYIKFELSVNTFNLFSFL